MGKLNPKQLKFIEGLLIGKSQYQAYKDAGFPAKNNATAMAGSSRLLRNVKIAEELNNRLEEIKNRNRIHLYRISQDCLEKASDIINENDEAEKNTQLLKIKADLIKDILDRIGLRLAEEHNINLQGKIEMPEEQVDKIIDLTKKAIERLETLPKDNTGSS